MKELWQNLQQLRQSLIDIGILKVKPKNPARLLRVYNWKTKCSEDILKEIDRQITYFQNDREFWYCLSYNLNPFTKEFICPVCKTNRLKFMGRCGCRFSGAYKGTCSNCSSNQLEDKKERTRATIAAHTDEDRQRIREKCRKTRLEHFGDPNYGLFGSKGFKQTMLNKYGDEHYSNHEKAKQTCLERYGVECNFQTEEFKKKSLATKIEKYGCGNNIEKVKATCQEKYNTDFYVQSSEFQEKAKNTMIQRYGSVEDSYQHRKEEAAKTKLERYNNANYSNAEKALQTRQANGKLFAEQNNATQVKDLVEKYGQGWLSLNIPRIYFQEKAYVSNDYLKQIQQYANESHYIAVSKAEIELRDLIKSLYSGTILHNKRLISKYELDIYLPELKLAFEYNGVYWHSINTGTEPDYHLNKTLAYDELGISVIHIFEDEWIHKKEACIELVKNAIQGNQIYTNIVNRCYYYPQNGYKIIEITEPRAFYFKKDLERVYITNENIQELLDKNYLVCYDCGQVILERTDEI